MVDVKQAAEKARAYAGDVLGVDDFLLEEVESDQDVFKITLSFPDRKLASAVNPLVKAAVRREYKTFDIDKNTGEIKGMKIRSL